MAPSPVSQVWGGAQWDDYELLDRPCSPDDSADVIRRDVVLEVTDLQEAGAEEIALLKRRADALKKLAAWVHPTEAQLVAQISTEIRVLLGTSTSPGTAAPMLKARIDEPARRLTFNHCAQPFFGQSILATSLCHRKE